MRFVFYQSLKLTLQQKRLYEFSHRYWQHPDQVSPI